MGSGSFLSKETIWSSSDLESSSVLFFLLKKYKKKYPNVPYKIEKIQEHKNGIVLSSRKGNKFHSYIDAPAYVLVKDGKTQFKKWYKEGKLHREYGPAVTRRDGPEEYFLNGIEYDLDEFKKAATLKKQRIDLKRLGLIESTLFKIIEEIF